MNVQVYEKLCRIETLLEKIMATQAQLQSDLDTIKAGVATANTSITNLQQQIAALVANQPVTQAQLDSMTAEADTIASALTPTPTPQKKP